MNNVTFINNNTLLENVSSAMQATPMLELYLLVMFADRSGMNILWEPFTFYRNFLGEYDSTTCLDKLIITMLQQMTAERKLILCKVSCNFSVIQATRRTMRYPLGSRYVQHNVLQGFPLLHN